MFMIPDTSLRELVTKNTRMSEVDRRLLLALILLEVEVEKASNAEVDERAALSSRHGALKRMSCALR